MATMLSILDIAMSRILTSSGATGVGDGAVRGCAGPAAGRARHTLRAWERLRSSVPASWARPCSRAAPRRTAGSELVITERRSERAAELEAKYGMRALGNIEAAPRRRHPRPRRQAPGHGRPARRDRRARSPTGTSSSASPRASRRSSSSPACPPGSSVVRVMPNTPALVDQGMAAISGGPALRREPSGRGRRAARRHGQGHRGPREAPGRRDGDLRVRPGLHLLRRRGDDRGRASSSVCRAPWRPSSSSRPSMGPRR